MRRRARECDRAACPWRPPWRRDCAVTAGGRPAPRPPLALVPAAWASARSAAGRVRHGRGRRRSARTGRSAPVAVLRGCTTTSVSHRVAHLCRKRTEFKISPRTCKILAPHQPTYLYNSASISAFLMYSIWSSDQQLRPIPHIMRHLFIRTPATLRPKCMCEMHNTRQYQTCCCSSHTFRP